MKITEVSIKRPSIIIVFFSVMILGGLMALKQLNYEMMPDFAVPTITVTTMYPGAAPSEVENSVTKKMEDALSGLENIEDLSSKSMENVSVQIVNFKYGTDIDATVQDAQRKIDQIKQDLPDDILAPSISKISPNDMPIMQIIATSNMDNRDFYTKMDKEILPQLQQIKGVAEITMLGGEEREIRVNVDKDKLDYYGLSLLQVTQAISQANIELPAGKMKSTDEQLTVKLAGKFVSMDDIKQLEIFSPAQGSSVKLYQIADVQDGIAEISSISRFNGKNGIGLQVKRQSDGNAVEVAEAIRTKLTSLEERYADQAVVFDIASDNSNVTIEAVDAVLHDLIIAIILVAAVMLLFLHSLRNAIIVLVSIPASLISAFIIMALLGYSLNLMTLLAMSLVIGILVDDSIVVLENIQRHLEMGKGKLQASIDGIREIGFAAVSITLVIVVVFLPLLFVNALIADILRQFSVVVVFTTLMSLIACITLTPWLTSLFGKVEHLDPKKPFQRFLLWFEGLIDKYINGSVSMLRWALNHKIVTTLIIIGMFVVTGAVMSMGIMGQEMVAKGDQGKFMVKLEFDKNVMLRQNNLRSLEIENYLLAKEDVVSVFANVGGPGSGMGSIGVGSPNKTEISVALKPKGETHIVTEEYMMGVKQDIEEQYPGIRVSVQSEGLVNSSQKPIIAILSGDNYDLLLEEAERLKKVIYNIPGTNDIEVSVESGNPEYRVKVDREKMANLGISMATVGGTLNYAYTGYDDSKYRDEKGDEFDIRVMLDAFDRSNADDLLGLTFISNTGEPVKLSQFATLERSTGPSVLERQNRRTSVTVSANVVGVSSGDVANGITKALDENPLAAGIDFAWDGDIKNQEASFGALGAALGVSLILIYFIMVLLYDDFIYPIVVLFSIPVALIGAFLALNLTMSNFSIFTMLGIIMLMGLVAKNAILIVDFTNHLKAEGKDTTTALLEAVKERLRPIIMTTLAMAIGMLPIALADGAGAEWKNGLAWVLIGGLTSSMLLTVVLVPMVYQVVDDMRAKVAEWRSRSQEEEEPVAIENPVFETL